MTDKEKAKAYDKALEIAKNEINIKGIGETVELCERLFPELRESEDERIINQLITLVNSTGGVVIIPTNKEELIAWLEKQKEQKPVNHNLTTFHRDVVYCAMCNKNLDEGLRYNLEIVYNVLKDIVAQTPIVCEQKDQKLVECELEDAFKNYTDAGITVSCGDIVAKPKEQKPVEIHIDNPNIQKVDPNVKISTSDSSASGDELLYVSNKSYRLGYQDGKREAGQKPAEWSKEEEIMLARCVAAIPTLGNEIMPASYLDKLRTWLKSLPERFNLQPKQEWSEKDKRKLNRIYEILGYAADDKGFLTSKRIIGDKEAIELQDFLKALRPSWKPSEEQMKALYCALCEEISRTHFDALESLYNDLKKLM